MLPMAFRVDCTKPRTTTKISLVVLPLVVPNLCVLQGIVLLKKPNLTGVFFGLIGEGIGNGHIRDITSYYMLDTYLSH
jgi:hypothetical protein